MIVPALLFLASLAGIVAAVLRPGLSDLLLLAVPCALGSLLFVLRALLLRRDRWREVGARRVGAGQRPPVRRKVQPAKPAVPQKWIVVDGSNVLHWKDNLPQIDTVRAVVRRLTGLGFSPLVVFDANAGYKITGTYKHDLALSRLLGLPEAQVMVVDSGTPADPLVLACARKLKAAIITNDRYRDWAAGHPEVNLPGTLIRGGFEAGALWLEIG